MSEKTLWSVVGLIIFGVIAGLYIADRRSMMHEETEASSQQASAQPSTTKSASSTSYQTAGSHKPMFGDQPVKANSMDLDEYLTKIKSERDRELRANAAEHTGYSGGIDDYKNSASNKSQTKTSNNNQSTGATSMSMEEYTAKNSGENSSGATSMSMDEYLAKNSGKQTQINNTNNKPFNKNEHMGFHGSYEEYAKKYN